MIRRIEDNIEAWRIRQPFHDIGIKAFILTTPDTARHITEIAAAVEMLKALRLRKGTNALPSSRPGIEKVRFITEFSHLRRTGCGIWCGKGFRHSGQVEVGIGYACHRAGHSRNGAGTIGQEGRTVIRILCRHQPA